MDSSVRSMERGFSIPKHWIISFLTIFSIGAQYFINLSYLLSQIPIQGSFGFGDYELLLPTILSYLAFATFLVVGPTLAKRYGLRNTYLILVLILICGSLMDAFSVNFPFFIYGRLLQGIASGALYMIMVPLTAFMFPTKRRNWFIFAILSGLFGSVGAGVFFGGLSLTLDTWRWLFLLSSALPILCLIVGYAVLPKQKAITSKPPVDKWGLFFLFAIGVCLIFPLKYLERYGVYSVHVWPFAAISVFLFILLIGVEMTSPHPLLPLNLLISPKPMFGTLMIVSANIGITCSVIGINGYLTNINGIHFISLTQFYLSFFLGTVASGLLTAYFYDKLGAGVLGIIASSAILYVSFRWSHMNSGVSLFPLKWEFAVLGAAFGIVLVTGSLGGALAAKNVSELPSLSLAMQYIRNLFSAFGSPLFGWAVYHLSEIHYENLRAHLVKGSPFAVISLNKISQYYNLKAPNGTSSVLAKYILVNQVQQESLLFAYQSLFMVLFILAIFMVLGAIGLAVTGKGLSIAQDEDPLAELFVMN